MKNQAKILLDYWTDDIEWFVVGGAATANEAQLIHTEYPDVKCIGFEPNPDSVDKQNNELGFPGTVYPYALWSERTTLNLQRPENATHLSASVCRPNPAPDVGGEHKIEDSYEVEARTLDDLDLEFGPFTNVALWIDIEYAEFDALKGAQRLLSERKIKLINLETFPDLSSHLFNLLEDSGFSLEKIWNRGRSTSRDAQDRIYRLRN